MWKKNERSSTQRALCRRISLIFDNLLMEKGLFVRTGVGANRTATAKRRGFRTVSTEISTDFSAAASENWFVTRFSEEFREVARSDLSRGRRQEREGGSKHRRQRAS
jgi:hypothetical protein